MRVFVLCTGRCGSLTFHKACSHFTNYTSGHETNIRKIGPGRLDYPDNHIEVDNRLPWMLWPLIKRYGTGTEQDDVLYVHLRRDEDDTARSYAKRKRGLMNAWARGVVYRTKYTDDQWLQSARDMVRTVNTNISHTLQAAKASAMTITVHIAKERWPDFCSTIGAKGNLKASVNEWNKRHNAS